MHLQKLFGSIEEIYQKSLPSESVLPGLIKLIFALYKIRIIQALKSLGKMYYT